MAASGKKIKKVMHVYNEPSFSNHVSKGVIYKSLQDGRRVGESEEHDGGFKEFFVGDESSLPLVTIFNVDIVVPPTNIKFREDLSILEFVNKVGNQGKGVGILDYVFIEVPIVLAGTESTIFLFDKEEESGLGEIQKVDFPSMKIFIEEVFSSFMLLREERIEFPNFGDEKVSKVDFMIVNSRRGNMVGGFLGEDRGELEVFGNGLSLIYQLLLLQQVQVAVVRWAMMGEPIEMNQDPQKIIC